MTVLLRLNSTECAGLDFKCTKIVWRPNSALTRWESAGLKGPAKGGGWRGEGKGGKRKEREKTEWQGRKGKEGRSGEGGRGQSELRHFLNPT